MGFLQYDWLPLAAAGISALLLFLWYLCYFRAMAPKKGTLEWISRVDRGRFPALSLQPVRAAGWIVLVLSVLLGAACSLLTTDLNAKDYWACAVLAALQAGICCLSLLMLYGVPVAALCGTVLLLACGAPSPTLLACLFALLLSLTVRRFWLQLLIVLPAVWCLLIFVGSSLGILWILIAYCLLYLSVARFHDSRSVWGVAGGLLLLLLVMAIAAAGSALLLRDPDTSELDALLTLLSRFLDWTPVLSPQVSLPALMTGTSAVVLLMQAAWLRDTRWLFGGLTALLSLPLLALGYPELTFAGCILALTGTFAGADDRDGRLPAILISALLTICILIS